MATKEVEKDELVLNAIFNPHNPLEVYEDQNLLKEVEGVDEDIGEELKQLEIQAVNAAQDGNLDASLTMFNKLLQQVPKYSSAYNNRAQLFRLKGDNVSAMEDLDTAIELCHGEGFVASQAHVQRGLLYHLNGDKEHFLSEFKKASKLGNKFAKQQLVSMNPYSALCNKMLGDIFAKEMNPVASE